MNPPSPQYLGDSVYATTDGYNIHLHLNSHEAEPLIYLEPEVAETLCRYIEIVQQYQQDKSQP